MFELGFTFKDVVRSAWVFATGFAVTFAATAAGPMRELAETCQGAGCDWNAVKAALASAALGAASAAAIAVKNYFLRDGTTVKG